VLAAHWEELSRFVLDRKVRSSLYRGPAGDLSHIQLAALTALADGDVRMGDLATRLGLAESSVTRLVDRLEGVGLAARRPSAGDRRCVEAGLTPSDDEFLARKLGIYGIEAPASWRKFVCGRKLWNYDNLEPAERKLVL